VAAPWFKSWIVYPKQTTKLGFISHPSIMLGGFGISGKYFKELSLIVICLSQLLSQCYFSFIWGQI